MKKIVLLSVSFLLVSCSANPKVEETIEPTPIVTPTITEETTDWKESKFDISLYQVEEYSPIVDGCYLLGVEDCYTTLDGIVLYNDGYKDIYNTGEYVESTEGRLRFYLYEETQKIEELSFYDQWVNERGYRYEIINDLFTIKLLDNLPKEFSLQQSSRQDGDIIDGVFGVEYASENGDKLPFVIFRYSNFVPEGMTIDEAIYSIIIFEDSIIPKERIYIWRIKDYDGLEFKNAPIDRVSAIQWWGAVISKEQFKKTVGFE